MEVFPGSNIVRSFTFKAMDTRDYYAPLAAQSHHLSMDPDFSRGQYAHFQDCFECLSPHEQAA